MKRGNAKKYGIGGKHAKLRGRRDFTQKWHATHYLIAHDGRGRLYGCAPDFGESAWSFRASCARNGWRLARVPAAILTARLARAS